MAQSSLPALEALITREAIKDTMYRAVHACDLNDVEAFNSLWSEGDVVFEINDGEKRELHGLPLIQKAIFERIGPMDTTHVLTNILVDVKDGSDTAAVVATSLNQHCSPGTGRDTAGPKYMVGSRYTIDFVKDKAGVWKIKTWVLNVIWAMGDASVMRGPA